MSNRKLLSPPNSAKDIGYPAHMVLPPPTPPPTIPPCQEQRKVPSLIIHLIGNLPKRNAEIPPTYSNEYTRPLTSFPPPLFTPNNIMPKKPHTITNQLETLTISQSQEPLLTSQNQNHIPCFSSQLPASRSVCIPRILPNNLTRHETFPSDPKPDKRKYRPKKAHPILICHICGDTAGKHSYYGGQACNSCRAFFRRAVQSEYNLAYFCIKDRTCKIGPRTRKKCQFCRYQACLASGMRTVWVLNEEEKEKFLENRKKKKKSKSDSQVGKQFSEPIRLGPRMLITEAEVLEINRYVKISEYFEVSKVKDMEPSLIRELIRLVAFQHPMSDSGQREIKKVLEMRSVRFARSVGDFRMLKDEDQQKILKRNIPMLMEMQICTFFQPDLVWRKQFTPLIGPMEVDKLDCKLKELKVKELDTLQVFYSSMFPSPPSHMEAQFADLLMDIGSWPTTADEYVLLSLLLLFCPDMLDLVERRQVEEIQLKFLILLQKYLNKKHQTSPLTAVARFAAAIDCLVRCKDLHKIFAID